MKEFQGKVAVLTGAASGIGRALALHCAGEGMKVVVADIELPALSETEEELKLAGAEVLALQTDVSKPEAVEKLARTAFEHFGAVHLLFNNAGVGGPGGAIWENSLADWEWVLGVNLWSIIHGIRSFVPRMLEGQNEGHIVNTASIAGLISYPGSGIYKVSKHAVVTLSETLYHELNLKESKIKVSVLCPAWVKTRITESERNRPPQLQNKTGTEPLQINQQAEALSQATRQAVESGIDPQEVAGKVFEAIREDKFYILTHRWEKRAVQVRMEDILNDRSPTNPLK